MNEALLHIESLPPQTTRGTIVRLLIQVGKVDKRLIGRVELRGRAAAVEVPARMADRLAAAIDGATLLNQKLRAWCERAPATSTADGQEDHFERLRRLLDLESRAEDQRALQLLKQLSPEEAQRTGRSLFNLKVVDEQSGLGGRTILRLEPPAPPLPWHRLVVGTPVVLSVAADPSQRGDLQPLSRGVVCGKQESALLVAVDQPPDIERGTPLRVDHSSDQVACFRMRKALDRARSAIDGRLAQFRKVLTGSRAPKFGELTALADEAESARTLNDPQREAIRHCLAAEDYAIIHGPPGTGKTTTLVEFIAEAERREQRVLACAPSNLAVDNLLEKLLQRGVDAVRLGHPARVLPELRERTLDLMVEAHPDMKLAQGLMREARQLRQRASRWTRAKQSRHERQALRDEAKLMMEDARRVEAQVVESILNSASVLCATTTSLDNDLLGRMEFEWAVIDEACQSTEPGCWIPLQRCQRLVLAGDHCQLPPTVVSPEAAKEGYNVSLMERMMGLHGPKVARQLEVQYRMHSHIAGFSSAHFYRDSLVADPSVAEHRLVDLPTVRPDSLTETPLVFFDTAGAGYDEELEEEGSSRRNPDEARAVVHLARHWRQLGVPGRKIAVISPYAAQVRLLRDQLEGLNVEADTVDGFQGREMEAVLISLVRCNDQGEIGFLQDVRRMNVAITRARRGLIIVGDSATIGGHPFYQSLLEYIESLGGYRTVWELDL